MRNPWVLGITAVLGLSTAAGEALSAGHGPAFALSTPTLGEGQWSSDTTVMTLRTEEDTGIMFREWLGCGLTEDLQLTLGLPLVPGEVEELNLENPPRTRIMAMMNGFGTVELGLLWRFYKQYPGGGQRYESTLMLNAGVPTQEMRGRVDIGSFFNVAVTTGYASRDWYWWVGAGYERYLERGDDRLGDLPYLTAAVGYRPPIFQQDYPKPDIRFFLEALAEFPREDTIDGDETPGRSGGTRVLLGPSVLGLFGRYGLEAGILFPVHQDIGSEAPEEEYRALIDFVVYF